MKRAGAITGARSGIVLAHGRGGDAAGMLALFGAAQVTDAAVIAPEAPGRSWWPSAFLAPAAVVEPHVLQGVAQVLQAVAVLEAEGLPRSRIWLGGFSQGACLALEAYARAGSGLAGVFAFSGGLLGTADAQGPVEDALYGHGPKRFDYDGTRAGGRVWLSVHDRDPHIPVKRVEESAAVLRGMGAAVDLRLHPGAGHAVLPEDLARLRDGLQG